METPLAVNPAPLTVTLEKVRVAVPEFETTNVCVTDLPILMLPKLKVEGLTPTKPCAELLCVGGGVVVVCVLCACPAEEKIALISEELNARL